jgi:PAS domain S-box-containing protein
MAKFKTNSSGDKQVEKLSVNEGSLTQESITVDAYRTVVHSAIEGFSIGNFKGEILDVNDAFCQMLGYNREEFLGMKIRDTDVRFAGMSEEKAQEIFKQKIECVKAAGGAVHESRHICKDGRVIDFLVSSKYLDINGGLIFAFHRDITKEKEVYRQLKESEDLYRTLIELGNNIGEAVIVLQDVDGREGVHTFVSDWWSHITGYTKKELLSMSFFDLVSSEDRGTSIERHRQKVSGKSLPSLFELSIIRRDGKKVPVELTSAYSFYDSQPVNVVYIRDITERKQAEERLKLYKNHLEELVEERTEQVTKVSEQLKEQIEQRNIFTRALVHELKTPLTPLLSASEFLSANLHEEIPREFAKNIHKGIINLGRRINELMDLARGEVGLLALNRKKIDLLQLIKETAAYYNPEALKKKQTIILELDDPIPIIQADADRIQEVLLNLLDNASKFTHKNGKITISTKRRKGSVVIEIKDTGIGISEELQECIFEPYKRLKKREEHMGGLRLGLALSKMLIEMHGGDIWVRSKKGKGTTVSFSIPLVIP